MHRHHYCAAESRVHDKRGGLNQWLALPLPPSYCSVYVCLLHCSLMMVPPLGASFLGAVAVHCAAVCTLVNAFAKKSHLFGFRKR